MTYGEDDDSDESGSNTSDEGDEDDRLLSRLQAPSR